MCFTSIQIVPYFGIEDLPNDLLGHTLKFLTREEVAKCSQVSRQFRKIANDNSLWYSFYRRDHPNAMQAWQETKWKSFLTRDLKDRPESYRVWKIIACLVLLATALGFASYSIAEVLKQHFASDLLQKPYNMLIGSHICLFVMTGLVGLSSSLNLFDTYCIIQKPAVYVYEFKKHLYRMFQNHYPMPVAIEFGYQLAVLVCFSTALGLSLYYVIAIRGDMFGFLIVVTIALAIMWLVMVFEVKYNFEKVQVPWKEPEIWTEQPHGFVRGRPHTLYVRQYLKDKVGHAKRCLFTVTCFRFERVIRNGRMSLERSEIYSSTYSCTIHCQAPLVYSCDDVVFPSNLPATSLQFEGNVCYVWHLKTEVEYGSNQYSSYSQMLHVQ